jgi:hypothetical protein
MEREREKTVPLLAQNKMPLSPAWTPPPGTATTTDDVGLINDDPSPHLFDAFIEMEPNLFDSNAPM